MPLDGAMHWSGSSPTSCTAGSFAITALYPGGCQEHTVPNDPYPAEQMDTGAFAATGVPTGNGAWGGTTADQEFYSYASSADAQAAYQNITHQILTEDSQFAGDTDTYNKNLAVTSTTVTTAQTGDGIAIDNKLRDSDGKPSELNGNPGNASDRHYYFAVKGDIVEMVVLEGGPAVSDTSGDSAALQTVVSALG
jgi:hypothetical protein